MVDDDGQSLGGQRLNSQLLNFSTSQLLNFSASQLLNATNLGESWPGWLLLIGGEGRTESLCGNWRIGELENWSIGVLEYWSIGVLEYESVSYFKSCSGSRRYDMIASMALSLLAPEVKC